MGIEDNVVLITGATGHLGHAVVKSFADAGARLILLGRRLDALESLCFHGSTTLLLQSDLLDAAGVKSAVDAALAKWGRVDALCHLAGDFAMGPRVDETTDADWDAMFDINVRSFLHVAHAVVPHMMQARQGRIVAVGAVGGQRGAARMGAYAASKSALIRLVESMAAELREHGINVNSVLPTVIDTPANRVAMPETDPTHWVAPEALADVIAFLTSDAARAIHGAAIPVSGLS